MGDNPGPNLWEAHVPDGVRQFIYPIGHVCSYDPATKREILLQFIQPDPSLGKNQAVCRLALNVKHAQELVLNIQNQLKKMSEGGQGGPGSSHEPKPRG